MKIMQELGHDKIAEWLFDHRKNPGRMLDERVQRFIDRRQPQNIAKCVWAYSRAKLGIKLSNLF